MARPVCWMGIDPSYSAFAIVRVHDDGTHHAQVLDFSPKMAGQGSQRLDMVFRVLQEKFETVYTCFDVKAVALEGYAMGAKFGREMAGEIGGLTRILVMRELKRQALIVPPTSLKKFVTNSGKATKDDMIRMVDSKWAVHFKSHDLADAFGLAQMAKASQRGTTIGYEREVLDALSKRNG